MQHSVLSQPDTK